MLIENLSEAARSPEETTRGARRAARCARRSGESSAPRTPRASSIHVARLISLSAAIVFLSREENGQIPRSVCFIMLLCGLASPGPVAYDTLNASDRRAVNPLRAAVCGRGLPAMGKPAEPARVFGRYREDEKRFYSARATRALASSSDASPGPAYALPSTFLAAATLLPPRAQLQAIRPRSNEQPRASQPWLAPHGRWPKPATASEQVVIGCERARARQPASATLRRYAAYAFPHDVHVPDFRASMTARPQTVSGAGGPGSAGAAAAAAAVVDARAKGRSRAQSASRPGSVQAWRVTAIHKASSTGVKLNPPGRSLPLRSAFIQPHGTNSVEF